MTFPLDGPLFGILYALLNTPGLGGLLVIAIVLGCLTAFAAALRWIVRGGVTEDGPVYPYPTNALRRRD